MTTPFTPVDPDKTIGSGDPAADMNDTSNELAAMGGSLNVLDETYSGGADATGAADSAAAFSAAVTALGGAPGYITVPTGTYKLASTVGPLTSGQCIVCMPGVKFSFTGTGACFRWVDTSSYNSRTTQGGGLLGWPVIDGTSAGNGSSALHAGDILQFRARLSVQNFTGTDDIGLHFDNQNYWTEQADVIAYLNNCTQFVVFDCSGADTSTGSYDRGDFTFFINQFNVAYNGVVWQNGAQQVGGRVRVLGNFETAASAPDSAVLTFTGTVPAGHPTAGTYAGLAQCELDVNVEGDEGHTYAPQTINFGAADNVIADCTGNVSFGTAFAFQESNVTATTTQFIFTGQVIGDPTLAVQTVPGRLSVSGEAFFFSEMFLGEISAPATPVDGSLIYADTSGNLHLLTPAAANITLNPDTTAADIQPVGTAAAAGAVGQPADAGHVHTGLSLVATTGLTGFALANSTSNVFSWTAPADGVMHRVMIIADLLVASSQTGGEIAITFKDPGGTSRTRAVFAGGLGSGFQSPAAGAVSWAVAPNETVTVAQTSAQSAGAATLWAEMWAL